MLQLLGGRWERNPAAEQRICGRWERNPAAEQRICGRSRAQYARKNHL